MMSNHITLCRNVDLFLQNLVHDRSFSPRKTPQAVATVITAAGGALKDVSSVILALSIPPLVLVFLEI